MFIRRIAEALRRQEWATVFVEFVLVVAGILIAFQIQSWNEGRVAKKNEHALLTAMRAELADDVVSYAAAVTARQRVVERGKILVAHLRAGEPYTEALDAEFGLMYGVNTFTVNRASYESLKSQGMGLISNTELRTTIVNAYEKDYRSVEYAIDVERGIIFDIMRPHFLAKFQHLEFGQSATPMDYQALLADIELINILDYRVEVLIQADLRFFEQAISRAEALIAAIDVELGEGH